MEEMHLNEHVNPKHSSNHAGPRISERCSGLGVTVFLGLLSVFLLVGIKVLGVLYGNSAAELSAVKHNLTELLQTSNYKLTKMTEELEELRRLSEQNKTCPAGWKMFSGSCYFFSRMYGSWDQGRQDCRDKGADLVVIDSSEEQMFLSDFTNTYTWIGLNDREVEGTWKWVDGTPLTLQYWWTNQPDNGGGEYADEDCVHFVHGYASWNDLSCQYPLQWICGKKKA